jgi:hypothetical protein
MMIRKVFLRFRRIKEPQKDILTTIPGVVPEKQFPETWKGRRDLKVPGPLPTRTPFKFKVCGRKRKNQLRAKAAALEGQTSQL